MGIIELGLIAGIALLISIAKMDWTWRLRVLSNPILLDVIIFTALMLFHWGTFSGVMVATIGAMICSLFLAAGRFAVGHKENGKYIPGQWDISDKLQLN